MVCFILLTSDGDFLPFTGRAPAPPQGYGIVKSLILHPWLSTVPKPRHTAGTCVIERHNRTTELSGGFSRNISNTHWSLEGAEGSKQAKHATRKLSCTRIEKNDPHSSNSQLRVTCVVMEKPSDARLRNQGSATSVCVCRSVPEWPI